MLPLLLFCGGGGRDSGDSNDNDGEVMMIKDNG